MHGATVVNTGSSQPVNMLQWQRVFDKIRLNSAEFSLTIIHITIEDTARNKMLLKFRQDSFNGLISPSDHCDIVYSQY
jgi:hypothetical protein